MTIRNIDLDSSYLQPGEQYRTRDGKLVTLKHVCVEEAPTSQPVSLSGMQIGQKARARDGRLLTLVKIKKYGTWPYVFSQERGVELSFDINGRWDGPEESERDIVEVLPLEAPWIRLEDLKIGQKVRDRMGRTLTYTDRYGGLTNWPYEFQYEDGSHGTFTPEGVFAASLKPSKRDIVEILPDKTPRVSLAEAKAGDRFHLRDGRIFVHSGGKTGAGNLKTRLENGHQGLVFAVDGSCPGLAEYADVIKISRLDLLERIAHRLQREGQQEVSRVQISSSQWLHLPSDGNLSVPLEPNHTLRHDEFSVVYKGRD